MVIPILLFLAALGLAVVALLSEGLGSDWLLLAFVTECAALILLVRAWRGRSWIVLDGSNVMYWLDETPRLDMVRFAIEAAEGRGYRPRVWFDANVGYLVGDGYLGPAALARRLGVSKGQVFVAPRGTPADPLLLKDAVARKARVITNDRFRDWAGEIPQVREEGFLIAPKMRDGERVIEF